MSVVVPAYNERERLPETLRSMLTYLSTRPGGAELIVVDDGSTDGTADEAEAILRAPHAEVSGRVLRHDVNRGKGAAVRTGVLAASGDTVLFSDADQSTPIADVEILSAQLEAGADVVIGSRALEGRRLVLLHQPWYRELMGRVFNLIVQAFLLPGLWDTQCGFKAFRGSKARELFGACRRDGFEFDVEVLYRARRRGLKVKEVAVHWSHSPNTRVSALRDSARMFRAVFAIRRDVR